MKASQQRRRRRVLVTGGAGFIGGHLVEALIDDAFQVVILDDLSTGRSDNVPADARLEQLDISVDPLEPIFRAWRPSVVYHLAAQSSVPASVAAPIRDLEVNVIGTHRVAGAARLADVERVVFVSSGGAVYGETRVPATERTLPRPASYYGIHKLAAEGHILLSGLRGAIVRPSNVYGHRQAAGLEGAVVAAFVGQALGGGPLVVHGDGNQTRDFVHVTDVVSAIMRLGERDEPIGIWNVAVGRSTTINELASVVEREVGRSLGRAHRSARAGDVRAAAMSAGALRRLGWRPTVTLAAGVADLIRRAGDLQAIPRGARREASRGKSGAA